MFEVRSPIATLLRRTPSLVLEGFAFRSTTPEDGTRTRFPQTFERRRSDYLDGGRDKVHAQRRSSIVQALGAQECLRAITAQADAHRRLPGLAERLGSPPSENLTGKTVDENSLAA